MLTTISDRKTPNNTTIGAAVTYYKPVIVTANDYYPFGMLMLLIQTVASGPGRNYNDASNKDYRYGFNGKENDNDVKGIEGGQQDYGMRIYDPRLGRFLSVDPISKEYPELTPYQFASNTPLQAIDLDGLEAGFMINLSLDIAMAIVKKTQGPIPIVNNPNTLYANGLTCHGNDANRLIENRKKAWENSKGLHAQGKGTSQKAGLILYGNANGKGRDTYRDKAEFTQTMDLGSLLMFGNGESRAFITPKSIEDRIKDKLVSYIKNSANAKPVLDFADNFTKFSTKYLEAAGISPSDNDKKKEASSSNSPSNSVANTESTGLSSMQTYDRYVPFRDAKKNEITSPPSKYNSIRVLYGGDTLQSTITPGTATAPDTSTKVYFKNKKG